MILILLLVWAYSFFCSWVWRFYTRTHMKNIVVVYMYLSPCTWCKWLWILWGLKICSFLCLQVNRLNNEGYYGGVRLLMAICRVFHNYCKENKIDIHGENFTLSYDTNIPRQVELKPVLQAITYLLLWIVKMIVSIAIHNSMIFFFFFVLVFLCLLVKFTVFNMSILLALGFMIHLSNSPSG